MTVPTPDTSSKRIEATIYDLHFQASNHETGDDADWTHAVADLLAAVTDERDDARKMLADAPHSNGCATKDGSRVYEFPPCDCWKAKL
jgi:hypothetical protein